MSAPPPGRDGDRDAVEAAWAEIVAHWDAEAPPVGAWPAQEDTDADAPRRPGAEGPAERADPPAPAAPDQRLQGWAQDQPADRSVGEPGPQPRPSGPRDAPVPVEHEAAGAAAAARADDEHFVPPVPPPIPRAGWRSWLPWAGVLGAPVALLVLVLLGQRPSGTPVLLLVAAFVAGFLTLVVRMPTSRDGDDDDGAVV